MKSGLNVDSLIIVNPHAWIPCHTAPPPMPAFQNVFVKKDLFLMQKDCVWFQEHVRVRKIWNIMNVEVLANQLAMTWLPSVPVFASQNVLAVTNISSTVKAYASTIQHVIQQPCHTGAPQQMSLPHGIAQLPLQRVPRLQAEPSQTAAIIPHSVTAHRTNNVRHHVTTLFQTVLIPVANRNALATMVFS